MCAGGEGGDCFEATTATTSACLCSRQADETNNCWLPYDDDDAHKNNDNEGGGSGDVGDAGDDVRLTFPQMNDCFSLPRRMLAILVAVGAADAASVVFCRRCSLALYFLGMLCHFSMDCLLRMPKFS